MTSLGFENYSEALKIYLAKYREVRFALHAHVCPVCMQTGRKMTDHIL